MKTIKMSAVVLSLLLAACSSDDDNTPQINDENGIQTISAEIIQPGSISSRVIVGGNPGDATRPFTWRADDPATKANEADAIYVYDTMGNAARFVYSEAKAGSEGIFTRDENVGNPIVDIKDALCVPTSVGRPKDLPAGATSEFNFMNTMLHNRGAENVPMYGEVTGGKIQFTPMAGMVEIIIKNFDAVKEAIAKDEIAKNQFGMKLIAYDESGNAKDIATTKAKLDIANKTVVFLEDGSAKDFIGLMVQDVAAHKDNKFYFPLVAGNYSKLEVSIHPLNAFKPAMVETATFTPADGKIANKIYSFEKEFTLK